MQTNGVNSGFTVWGPEDQSDEGKYLKRLYTTRTWSNDRFVIQSKKTALLEFWSITTLLHSLTFKLKSLTFELSLTLLVNPIISTSEELSMSHATQSTNRFAWWKFRKRTIRTMRHPVKALDSRNSTRTVKNLASRWEHQTLLYFTFFKNMKDLSLQFSDTRMAYVDAKQWCSDQIITIGGTDYVPSLATHPNSRGAYF